MAKFEDELIVQQGPQAYEEPCPTAQETQLMQNMIDSFDKLKESVDRQSIAAGMNNATMAQFAESLLQDYSSAEAATAQTRDAENLKEGLSNVLVDHLEKESGILSQYLDKLLVGGSLYLGGAARSGIKTAAGFLPSYHAGGIAHAAAHAWEIESKEGQQVIGMFTGKIDELIHEFEGSLKSVETITSALTALTGFLTFGGIATGIMAAFDIMHKSHKFKVDLLKKAPGAAEHIYESMTGYRNGMNLIPIDAMKQEIKDNLIDADPEELLGAALFPQLARDETVSATSIRNSAWTAGVLKNRGVDPNLTKSLSASMIENLGMSSDEISYGMLSLGNTAAKSGLDISAYMQKIVGMTVQFKSMGVTVAGIDKLYQDFANTTLPNGTRLAFDAAMEAAKMYLEMRTSISDTMASYVALSQGHGLHGGNSEGFGGSSTSLAALASNPLTAALAGRMMKTSVMPGANEAIAGFYNSQVDHIMDDLDLHGLGKREQTDLRYLLTAQVMGLSDKYMMGGSQGEATQALVQKVANRDFKRETTSLMDEFRQLTQDPMEKVRKKVEKEFPALMTEQNEELVAMSNLFKDFELISNEIKMVLADVMLPLVQHISAGMGALGTFFKAGGFNDPIHAYEEASHAYEHILHYFKEDEKFYGAVSGNEGARAKMLGAIGEIKDRAFPDYDHPYKASVSKSGYIKNSKGSDTRHLHSNKDYKFGNKIWFSTKDKLTDDQVSFLQMLSERIKDDKILKRVQVSSATAHKGHSDGRGGEHKHGNAFDFGWAGMSAKERARLAEILAEMNETQSIGSTYKQGKYGKFRQLPNHTDHYHVVIKSGFSKIKDDLHAKKDVSWKITDPSVMSKRNPLTFDPVKDYGVDFTGGKAVAQSVSKVTVTQNGKVVAQKEIKGVAVAH